MLRINPILPNLILNSSANCPLLGIIRARSKPLQNFEFTTNNLESILKRSIFNVHCSQKHVSKHVAWFSRTGILSSTVGNQEITTLPSCQFAHFLLLAQLNMSWHVLRKSTTYGDHLCRHSQTARRVQTGAGNSGRRALSTFGLQGLIHNLARLGEPFPRDHSYFLKGVVIPFKHSHPGSTCRGF